VHALEGDVETAQQLADEAVRWISETDMSFSAQVLEARAEVLRAAGRLADARRDLQAALRTYELKGDRPCTRRTQELLAGLG
jgi:hypothetical protein